jgi:hypothetical protein
VTMRVQALDENEYRSDCAINWPEWKSTGVNISMPHQISHTDQATNKGTSRVNTRPRLET